MKKGFLFCLISLTLIAGVPPAMRPRVLLDGFPSIAIRVEKGKILVEPNIGENLVIGNDVIYTKVAWDGYVANITKDDRAASDAWIKAHSQLSRLHVKESHIYLDGLVVDIGDVDVEAVWEAIPWRNGLLCRGRTYPHKPKITRKSWKNMFSPDVREIEPYCAIWIDQNTHKGTDLWINAKSNRKFIVFPLPK